MTLTPEQEIEYQSIKLSGEDKILMKKKIKNQDFIIRSIIRSFIKSCPKDILRDELMKLKIINKRYIIPKELKSP